MSSSAATLVYSNFRSMKSNRTSKGAVKKARDHAQHARRRLRSKFARIGFGVLIVGVLLLAVVGALYLTRGTAVRNVRAVGSESTPVAPGEPEFPISITMLTGAPLSTGNRVEVALNGDGTYERLWEDLRSAKQSITLQLYYGQGKMAETLRQVLLERAAAGVKVYMLYDAFGWQLITSSDRAALMDAGVAVAPFRPLRLSRLHLAQNRSHVRGIVVDSRIAWTGGFGIDDKWLGDGLTDGAWRETNVRFEGPAVHQLQAAFAAAWVEATGELFSGRATLTRYEGGVEAAGLLYTTPTMGSTPAERFMALSIAGARQTLYITNAYFAPDENFVNLLMSAAKRGVDVRILTGGPLSDLSLVRMAGRSRYEMLLSAGVRIYEWQPTTLHSKTFVVDGMWSSIGSMNFDNRSLGLNDEATLMILDRNVGRRMNEIFLDDLRHAEEIKAETFAERSWFQRVQETTANFLNPLL
jgi:cardiolipin synthase